MGLLANMYVQASLVLVDFAGIYPLLALEKSQIEERIL
jgi:hypothetical protein